MEILNSWNCGEKKKAKLFLDDMIFKHMTIFTGKSYLLILNF